MYEGSSAPATSRSPAGDPRKLDDQAATWEAPPLRGPQSLKAGGKTGFRALWAGKKPGPGRAGVGGIQPGGFGGAGGEA